MRFNHSIVLQFPHVHIKASVRLLPFYVYNVFATLLMIVTFSHSVIYLTISLTVFFIFLLQIISSLDMRFAFSSAAVRAKEEQTMMNALAKKMADGLEVR